MFAMYKITHEIKGCIKFKCLAVDLIAYENALTFVYQSRYRHSLVGCH